MKLANLLRRRHVRPLALFAAAALATAVMAAPRTPGTGGSAAAAAAPASGSTRIGVANVSRIFNEMQETKELKEKLEARRQELGTQEKDKRANIKDMEDKLRNLKPDHPQYKEEIEKLDKAMAELDSWGKVIRLEAERDQKLTMRTLFEKIKRAVGDVAREQGYDLIIADQGGEFPNIEQVNFDQLRGYINQQNVLYSTKGADVSDAVLTLLDANYAKGKASK